VSGRRWEWVKWWKVGLQPACLAQVQTFLSFLGFVFFLAFTSFGTQGPGLIGSHGIAPLAQYLHLIRESAGSAAFWEAPTILWLSSKDWALQAVWIAGALFALAAIFAPWKRPALAVCLALWLSLCSVGQDFLSFQWDTLLVETGFLALFADASAVRVWLFRWLLFRLMFFSGVVKLASHDPSWRHFTALRFHYETQPLPTPLAWYAFQLPLWFHQGSTAFVLLVELVVPLLFFAPNPLRRLAGWVTVVFQLLILATGNYNFFNILTIALVFWLFLDAEPGWRGRLHRAVSIGLAAFVGALSALVCLEQLSIPLPPAGAALVHAFAPFDIVNPYGLFAVMTASRPEIVIEASNDGQSWTAYEFRYKPGDLRRAPPWVEPDQPRLDWQMWFAALGSYQENRWFPVLLLRLLQGEPSVLKLLARNPFPHGPPRYIRARLYLYHFTGFGSRNWWTREERGLYFPAVSLR
jgi:hypothetical protein